MGEHLNLQNLHLSLSVPFTEHIYGSITLKRKVWTTEWAHQDLFFNLIDVRRRLEVFFRYLRRRKTTFRRLVSAQSHYDRHLVDVCVW